MVKTIPCMKCEHCYYSFIENHYFCNKFNRVVVESGCCITLIQEIDWSDTK